MNIMLVKSILADIELHALTLYQRYGYLGRLLHNVAKTSRQKYLSASVRQKPHFNRHCYTAYACPSKPVDRADFSADYAVVALIFDWTEIFCQIICRNGITNIVTAYNLGRYLATYATDLPFKLSYSRFSGITVYNLIDCAVFKIHFASVDTIPFLLLRN